MDTAFCYFVLTLGAAWETLGEAKKAIGYYERALVIDEKTYGPDHPDVAGTLNNMGTAWYTLGEVKKTIDYFERALAIIEKTYGPNHPKVAISLGNLGGAWYTLGKAKKATNLNNLGSAWKDLGQPQKALEFLEKALFLDEKKFVEKHPRIARDFNSLGDVWKSLGNLEKASHFYGNAYQDPSMGEDHFLTKKYKMNLEEAQKRISDSVKEKSSQASQPAAKVSNLIGFFEGLNKHEVKKQD